jgi:hypothetical protein
VLGLLYDHEEGNGMFTRNVKFSELPSVTTQNTAFFITTAVRTLNPVAEMDKKTM